MADHLVGPEGKRGAHRSAGPGHASGVAPRDRPHEDPDQEQNGTWAVPAGADFDAAIERAMALIERAESRAPVFDVTPTEASTGLLEELHVAEREAEWGEFVSDCARFDAEIASEIAKKKFTLAELDEEEQNLDRLRRWYREIRSRDIFGAPSADLAERRLKDCAVVLEDFANQVYEARERR